MPVKIGSIAPTRGHLPEMAQPQKERGTVSFGEFLKNVINHTDELQKEADRAVEELAGGNLDNLHDLMIAVEQAQLSLQLTVQVVNKVVQAYQEVYRMQI